MLFIIFVVTLLTSCSNQNLDKGIVEVNNEQYSKVYNFQLNKSYFSDNGINKKNLTKITTINGTPVYSIEGLNVKDWIYFDYVDCDVSFFLSKNIGTKLDKRYFDFTDKFELIKYNYTVKNGEKKVFDKTIENKNIVSYVYKIASSNGNTDMGVTSDKTTYYSILLTPKDFPSLQYVIGYYECENGNFIGSNSNNLNNKVDKTIHEFINSLK